MSLRNADLNEAKRISKMRGLPGLQKVLMLQISVPDGAADTVSPAGGTRRLRTAGCRVQMLCKANRLQAERAVNGLSEQPSGEMITPDLKAVQRETGRKFPVLWS